MRYIPLILFIWVGGSLAQHPRVPPPWGQGIQLGKPNRPSPFGGSGGLSNKQSYPFAQDDDPVPSNSRLDSTYDTQQLPAKLPILAPNGVVEIYNRVVDDLLQRLQTDFKKREIDPMDVVIRPTPGGPVRVPGHLQKRPFRRPGAALYRTGLPFSVVPIPPGKKPPGVSPGGAKSPKRKSRADDLPPSTRFPADRPQVSSAEEKAEKAAAADAPVADSSKPSFRGAGKISKGPITEDDEKDSLLPETTTVASTTTAAPENKTSTTVAPEEIDDSSEEDEPFFSRARSDEYNDNNNEDELDLDLEAALDQDLEQESKKATNKKTGSKKEGTDEELEDEEEVKDKLEGSKDVETLLQRYQNKNTDKAAVVEGGNKKQKYSKKKAEEKEKTKKQKLKEKEVSQEVIEVDDEDEDDFDNSDSREDDDDDIGPGHGHGHGGPMYHDGLEPGTLQSGGNRPNGGFYPNSGPPAVPAKPNAQLTGLSKIRRASDVSVSVDARSAVITARLLVGPLHVVINDSVEPLERNVRATIPELEAELLLMERHGVVFLQRFTLDRAYGQDVEISIPKSKGDSNKKKKVSVNKINGGGPPADANTNAQQRYQTKMAAHVSMEIVKLLRSGNLRVNLMRTAQSSMSKLKLPIQKPKKSKKKSKKNDKAKSSAKDE